MADISKIKLPSGTIYDIKDQGARDLIEALNNYSSFLGVTTTEMADGRESATVIIDGQNVVARAGSIVTYGSAEYIYNGSAWQAFGDLSALGNLAYKNNAKGKVTPSGSVSQPTFSGTGVSYTPAGKVSVDAITPAGTVSQPYFTGTQGSVSVSGSGTVSAAASGTATYTPVGSVSKPLITVNPTTTTVNSITAVGTLPSLTTTVTDEVLTISFSQGTLPTKGSNTTVMTGATASASAPTFTGTGARLVTSSITSTGKFTPAGSVSQPAFTGTEVTPTGSFSGTAATITAKGTVSNPKFTGTETEVTVS